MKNIPIGIAKKLLQLKKGEVLPGSSMKHKFVEELVEERIIFREGRIQKKLSLIDNKALDLYLYNRFGIRNIEEYVAIADKSELSRADLTATSGDSKWKGVRTFKGFLVNSFEPISVCFHGRCSFIHPVEGMFQFIYDFEAFVPDAEVVIVGVENAENFREIEKQRYLFKDSKVLFISRYPQNQNKDVITWLSSIPNAYLHFGDFDLAGINIYWHEYKRHLGERAQFFIPQDIENKLAEFGNKNRYDLQRLTVNSDEIKQDSLLKLIDLIHKHKKGLDQEIYIKD